jgi:hypothetical protein
VKGADFEARASSESYLKVTYYITGSLLLREIITVCTENQMKHINTPKFCGHNSECFNTKTGGT